MSGTYQCILILDMQGQTTKHRGDQRDRGNQAAQKISELDTEKNDAQPRRIPNSFLLSCSRFITENEEDIISLCMASIMFILVFILTAYLRQDEETD